MWQCYSTPSKLLYKNNLLYSSVGCQQGDPLGPAIFSLAIHQIIQKLKSKFNVWYLDDGTLGGDAATVLSDLRLLILEFRAIGLELNFNKCELFILEGTADRDAIISQFSTIAPNIITVNRESLRLLGSPILDESLPDFINDKILKFNETSERLLKINCHMAFAIIRFCLFVPKFTYVLRCCQLWKQPNLLTNLDNTLRRTLSTVFNIDLDTRSWTQATLPVRFGGLGIRNTSDVSLPAFLASVHATLPLTTKILEPCKITEISFLTEAKNAWCAACPNTDPPTSLCSQRLWGEPLCKLVRNNLLETSSNPAERARLIAVGKWESGLWLQALPSGNTGTLLDNTTFRIVTCLRLGAPIIIPHTCRCGAAVNRLGQHGLSCSRSAGRIPRHQNINDVIRRALATAGVPAILEPNGLTRDDGKRPDGLTLVPWRIGRALVWDATCVDTLAPSHLHGTSTEAGAAANNAENLKRHKYSVISSTYIFEPFGVETLGPWGHRAHHLFREISKRLVEATRDPRAGGYLAQRISLAIQRGNAASILGTLPPGEELGEVFYL